MRVKFVASVPSGPKFEMRFSSWATALEDPMARQPRRAMVRIQTARRPRRASNIALPLLEKMFAARLLIPLRAVAISQMTDYRLYPYQMWTRDDACLVPCRRFPLQRPFDKKSRVQFRLLQQGQSEKGARESPPVPMCSLSSYNGCYVQVSVRAAGKVIVAELVIDAFSCAPPPSLDSR